MKIIDRYLLRQFLQVFVICYCSLTGLYVVFDAFGNLDNFLNYAEKQGNLLVILGEFYAYRAIFFFDRISGILTMISAMFTVTWIQRHNELTALMAAGISRARVVRPILVAAILISLLTAANRETIIPKLREQLSRDPKDLQGEVAYEMRPRRDNETDILLRGKMTFAKDQCIKEPSFLLPQTLDKHGYQLVAAHAFYKPPQGSRPAGYLFQGVTQPADLGKQPSLWLGKRRVIITPLDEPEWLKPDQCFVASEVSFEQLIGGQGWRQFSSTRDLIAGLSNRSLDFGADVRVAIHARFVQPLLDITLLFLGLPLVLSRENRNMFLAIGICMGITAVFMIVVMGFRSLGSAGLLMDPALSTWVPLMIFVPIAAALFDEVLQT
jgi:lipopolysaccharide export system permease protein